MRLIITETMLPYDRYPHRIERKTNFMRSPTRRNMGNNRADELEADLDQEMGDLIG
jgi:hypothetical protein